MPIDLRAKMSGGGSYEVGFFSGSFSFSSASVGTLIDLTASEGKKVRLENLEANNIPDVTVEIDGVTIVDGFTLGATVSGSAGVVKYFTVNQAGTTSDIKGCIRDLVGESIKVYRTTPDGVNFTVHYSYSESK